MSHRHLGRFRSLMMVAAVAITVSMIPLVPFAQPANASARDYFPVPAAALVRQLGEIASGSCAPPPAWQTCQGDSTPVESPNGLGSVPGDYPMTVPGLGIPVGGVGAGSFMINQAGTFGPWNFGGAQGNTWETRILPQAAFHVREQIGSDPAVVKTLATDGPTNTGVNGKVSARSWGSPLPTWNALQPGEGTTAALYPFGWESFAPFRTDVSLRYFSPIVAGEDRRTSLPLVYFDVRIANHTANTADVSVMFTMPNAPDHVAGSKGDPSSPDGPASVRTGLETAFRTSDGVQAVTLSANDASNTPDAADSEWTIAAKPSPGQKVTFATSWNANGDGSDVYAPFVASGSLPNGPIDSSNSAAAISVSAKLQPGQVATVPFALAWDFPRVGFDDNQTVWMRRYTDFYGAQETSSNDYVGGSYPGHQGFAIARDALNDHDANLAAVENWWAPIATNAAYPTVLRTAALNQLSQLAINGSFWEGGLVSNTVTPTGFGAAGPGNHLDATRPGSHLFGIMVAGGGGVSNEGWLEIQGTRGWSALFKLFPNLLKDEMEAQADAATITPYGNTTQGLYSVNGDPFITFATGTGSAAIQDGTAQPSPCQTQFLDNESNMIFEFYAYWKITGDTTFLHTVYNALKGNIAYLQGTIPEGTYLPCDSADFANVLDAVPQGGTGLINAEGYLLSLEAGISAGTALGDDPGYVSALREDLARAKSEFEATLWNPVQQYYRFTSVGPYADAALSDGFSWQYLAAAVGLPEVVDRTHHLQELTTVFPQFLRRDATGALTGAVILQQPAGVESPLADYPPLASNVAPFMNYTLAADLYRVGQDEWRPDLQTDALQLASAVAGRTWLDDSNGYQFDAPWGYAGTDPSVYNYPATANNLAVWDLLDAIQPITPAKVTIG